MASPAALALLSLLAAFVVLHVSALREARERERWIAALLPAGVLLVAAQLVEWIAKAPEVGFNATRVASSIAMARGYNLLQGPLEGPVIDFMYGPVSAAAYVPAIWSPTPSGAIWSGVVLSFLFVAGSFAGLAFGLGPRSRVLAGIAVPCFMLLGARDPALASVASTVVADAPAMALAACACVCCLSSHGGPSNGRMALAAVFAVLAVWAKQTAVPIVVALPAWIWLREGRALGMRFLLWMGVVGAAISTLFLLRFGFEGIAFTMFQIPAGHPWARGAPTFQNVGLCALFHSLQRLGGVSRVSGTLLAAVVAAHAYGVRIDRRWLRARPWLGLAWVGVLMIPVSVLGGAKVGGDRNCYVPTTYFLMGAGVLGLVQLVELEGARRRVAATVALTGIIVMACVNGMTVSAQTGWRRALTDLRGWRSNAVERATAFARKHPHQVLFAEDPLIGLYSDGLLYNSTVGYGDRVLAGYAVPQGLRERYLPRDLRYVAYRRGGLTTMSPAERARIPPSGPVAYVRGFGAPYFVPEIPEYLVWVRKPRRDTGTPPPAAAEPPGPPPDDAATRASASPAPTRDSAAR